MANNFSLNLCFKRINYHNFKLGLLINVRNISNDSSLAKKTCLHDYHVQKGGKMVNFAGFIMPVSYNDQSIIDSHLHTRKSASLFDVSHMLQMMVKGKDCVDFMESITVADIATLKPNSGTLTLYTNDNGGIIDDLIVTKISQDSLFVVSNAGRIDQDLAHVNSRCQEFKSKGKDVSIEVIQNRALLALQGPSSAEYLQSLVKVDLSKLYFMTTISTSMSNIEDCRVTRCGYTGEDGFEISIPKDKAEFFADKLLSLKGLLDKDFRDDFLIGLQLDFNYKLKIVNKQNPHHKKIIKLINKSTEHGIMAKRDKLFDNGMLLLYYILQKFAHRETLEIIKKLLIVKNDSLINLYELESLFYLVLFALSLSFVLLMIEFLYFTISKIQYRHAERRIQFLRENQIFMWLNNSIFKNNS